MTARVTVAALIVVLVCQAAGLNYPAWAAMGAVAVMQGRHLHISMHRALQRMAGTMVGAAFAWLLLAQEPSVWIIIAALVLLQFLTEVVIGFNYAIAQVLVTPMALLMTYDDIPRRTDSLRHGHGAGARDRHPAWRCGRDGHRAGAIHT